ncbi:Rv1733c family protein [Streptomyces sp. NPDC055099]
MHAAEPRQQLLWRWRSNPLRRREDLVEAWIILAVWTVIALGGAFVGVVTARAADESFTRLREGRHAVRAVLVENTAGVVPTDEDPYGGHVRAKVRWTASDGSIHTGRASVDSGRRAGSKVLVWMDSRGRLTTEPPTAAEAAAQAGMLGAGAALFFGGVTFAAGRVVQWRLDRRRYDQWGREWDQIGPQWGRRTT